MLAVGPLGILVLHRRDLDHLAVITLAAQPTKKGAFEQLGVETVSLGTPMLARHRHTRCVNDVGLDAARLEPARQPEAVTAMPSFEIRGVARFPGSPTVRASLAWPARSSEAAAGLQPSADSLLLRPSSP